MKNDGFQQTNRMTRVTLSGWDGKSYNGEGRNLRVFTNPMHPGKEFVRLNFRSSRCYHVVTDKKHPVSGERMVEFFTYFD